MRTFFLFICLFNLSALSIAQEESLNDFRRAYYHRDGIHHFTIPGFLVRLAGNIAFKDESTVDREAVKPLIKNIGSVSIFIADDHARIDQQDIRRLKTDLIDEDYEPIIKVRDGRDDVEIFAWSKKEVIRRIVFFIQDGNDEVVLVNIRGYFSPDNLNEVIHQYKSGKDYEEGNGLRKL
jgi:hypothetical protein